MRSVSSAVTLEAHEGEASTVTLTICASSDSTPSMPLQQRLVAEHAAPNVDGKDNSRAEKPQVEHDFLCSNHAFVV
jgi:hypothetical protein